MVMWCCTRCGYEFDASDAPCQLCPKCGEHLTAGYEPWGRWEGFVFVPECPHKQQRGTTQ